MHVLEFFGDGCGLCQRYLDEIQQTRCGDCELHVYDRSHHSWDTLRQRYGVTQFPTLIVDQETRIDGHEDSRWLCDGPFSAARRGRFPAARPLDVAAS